ncbi:MAG: hypothetical protein AAGC46_17840, partial [Solirubrobacteraceae bacterium]|nr:hypothetical protein [Patulibacter sp.]
THAADLRVVASARGMFARRTVARDVSPQLWDTLLTDQPQWLVPPVGQGLYLPPHLHLLVVPFSAGGRRAIALLSFDRRRHFSDADLQWLAHVLAGSYAAGQRQERAARLAPVA